MHLLDAGQHLAGSAKQKPLWRSEKNWKNRIAHNTKITDDILKSWVGFICLPNFIFLLDNFMCQKTGSGKNMAERVGFEPT